MGSNGLPIPDPEQDPADKGEVVRRGGMMRPECLYIQHVYAIESGPDLSLVCIRTSACNYIHVFALY